MRCESTAAAGGRTNIHLRHLIPLFPLRRGGDNVHLRSPRGGGSDGAVRRRGLRRLATRALYASGRHRRASLLPSVQEETGERLC